MKRALLGLVMAAACGGAADARVVLEPGTGECGRALVVSGEGTLSRELADGSTYESGRACVVAFPGQRVWLEGSAELEVVTGEAFPGGRCTALRCVY